LEKNLYIKIRMEFLEINLNVIPVYTLFGIRYLYELPESSYGEFIICEAGVPKYYLNIFDELYLPVFDKLKEQGPVVDLLQSKFIKMKSLLRIEQSFFGFYAYSKEVIKTFKLEKLPLPFF
jgi:hypothetical protein